MQSVSIRLLEKCITHEPSGQCPSPKVCPSSCTASFKALSLRSCSSAGNPYSSCLSRCSEITATPASPSAWPKTKFRPLVKRLTSVMPRSFPALFDIAFSFARKTSDKYCFLRGSNASSGTGIGSLMSIGQPKVSWSRVFSSIKIPRGISTKGCNVISIRELFQPRQYLGKDLFLIIPCQFSNPDVSIQPYRVCKGMRFQRYTSQDLLGTV